MCRVYDVVADRAAVSYGEAAYAIVLGYAIQHRTLFGEMFFFRLELDACY